MGLLEVLTLREGIKKDEDFFTVAVLDVLEEQRSAGIANAARTGNNLNI